MKETIIPVESIQERDVDLILLEELSTDSSFCEWFVSELNLPVFTSVDGAWRSISAYGLGETDILFSYNSKDKKIIVLVENKLDASFQNDQFKRYVERSNAYVENNECEKAFTVLVAPKMYCENQNEFEHYLTYEAIAQRLETIGTKRAFFKKDLLKIAVEKLRRGYQPVNSVPVQKFWNAYWHYKEDHFPELFMKKPGIVPHNSDWPMLNDDRLKNIVFYHKLAQGNTDATFIGFPDSIELVVKKSLPEWATFVSHNKSFSIRVFSGKIDRTKEFNKQIQTVDKGLKNLIKIRNWILENNKLLFK